MAKKKVLSLEEKLEEALIPKEDQPYEMPKNWEWVKLGSIIKLKNGVAIKSSEYGNGEIPLIRISNIKNNNIDILKAVRIKIDKKLENYIIKKDDLLLAMSGATTGKMGVYKSDEIVIQNQRVGNLKIILPVLNKEFRNYFFQDKVKYILDLAYGGAQPNISTSLIESLYFPLPPKSEQERIVKKLENMLSKTKKAKELISEARKTFELRRASILHKAFTGELTKEWREENSELRAESIDGLLEKINEEKMGKWEQECQAAIVEGKKKPRKPKVSSIEDMKLKTGEHLYEIPKSWEWVKLGEIANKITDGAHKTPTYLESGIPFISAKNIKGNHISFNNTRFIPKEEHEQLIKRCNPETGDLLITKSGTIGRVAIVEVPKKFSLFESVALVKLSSFINSKYFMYQTEHYIKQVSLEKITKGIAIQHYHLVDIKTQPCSLPLLVEQEEIVKRIEELLKAEEEAMNLLMMDEQIDLLEKSILSKAFRGELGTNDPNDEPAMELLRRVLGEEKKGG